MPNVFGSIERKPGEITIKKGDKVAGRRAQHQKDKARWNKRQAKETAKVSAGRLVIDKHIQDFRPLDVLHPSAVQGGLDKAFKDKTRERKASLGIRSR
jgi:hypothetical protein